MPDLGACQPIQDKIDGLENEIEALQQEIFEVPPSARPGIRKLIFQLNHQIRLLEQQLQQCLLHPPSNLVIAGIELTQAIQYFRFNGQGSGFEPDDTVPLVANKVLILRVYIDRTTVPTVPIPATLTGTVSYAGHPDLTPINGPILGAPSSLISRGDPNQTLNFRVPAEHCTGTVQFTARVFDPAHPSDPASSSAPVIITASFDVVPQVRIHGVLIHYTGRGLNIPAPTGVDLINTLVYVGKTYPISGFHYTACDTIDFNGDLTVGGGGGCGTGWNQLFNTLWNMRNASNTNDVFVGLLPNGVPTSGVIGCGGGGVAIAYVGGGTVLAQEVGHAFGRAHAPCGNPGGPDPNYPTYDSYPSASIGEFGFDTASSQVFNPASTYDFMSYCGPVWVSPYTYIALKNAITASPASAHPERAGGKSAPGEYLYINFRAHRDGKVDLLPSFHLDGMPPRVEVGPRSPISCHLLGGQGEILESHHCHLNDPHQDPDDPYLELHEVLPWYAETRVIAFFREGKLCHELEVESEPPRVCMQPPARLEEPKDLMRVEWYGEHPKTPVTYVLRYSHDDGKTWRAVIADLTEHSHVVNLDLLPGGERCKFQVVASAGTRTALAETGTFSVPQKPRKVYILSPERDSTFRRGEPVVLLGGGFSPDFQTTDFEDVTWTSSIDGLMGVGYQVIVHTLSVGRHKITLSFPDGLGGEASGSIFVRIEPRQATC
jgi:hypothetical protein